MKLKGYVYAGIIGALTSRLYSWKEWQFWVIISGSVILANIAAYIEDAS